MHVRHYRDLMVWQKAMDFVVDVYSLAREIPSTERFGLMQQLQRAAVSIPSNIAEGHQRRSRKEYLRFLSIARGSLAEAETQIMLLARLDYTSPNRARNALFRADEIGRMLRSLEKRLVSPLDPSP